MHIICPHCTTSYAIELATLGVAGRTVRCSRCRQVWLARPQDGRMTHALVPSMAGGDPAWNSVGSPRSEPAADLAPQENQPPVVESPSISADWPGGETGSEPDLQAVEGQDVAKAPPARRSRRRRSRPAFSLGLPRVGLGTLCAGM